MIRNLEEVFCPNCNLPMKVRDSRLRHVKDVDGNTHTYRIRRLECRACHRVDTELPDCLVAYKHYSKDVIDSVRNGNCDYFGGDDKTIYRWMKK